MLLLLEQGDHTITGLQTYKATLNPTAVRGRGGSKWRGSTSGASDSTSNSSYKFLQYTVAHPRGVRGEGKISKFFVFPALCWVY
jgi:hypothetical protein